VVVVVGGCDGRRKAGLKVEIVVGVVDDALMLMMRERR